MAAQTPLHSANYSVIPETVIKGRLVCVGDAGGSCHPLSATGLSACTRDAMLLRQSLREAPGDLPGALQRYSTLRAEPQRTRLSGAEVLYEVFKAGTPEMRLLRQGLLRYWQRSARGRAATMALLSTQEGRTSVLMREYIQVYRHALAELIHGSGNGAQPVETRGHAMVGLSRALVRFVVSAVSK
jgi:2-polyprenyl-6-methoxyphenol hydroxylase-like FAD-dependent oxidoreductase